MCSLYYLSHILIVTNHSIISVKEILRNINKNKLEPTLKIE